MNNLLRLGLSRLVQQKTSFNSAISGVEYIATRLYAKNKDGKCNVDKCGCPLPKKKSNKPYEIVKEKSCTPCSFWSWKPKVVKLGALKEKPCLKKYESKPERKPRKCFPGMKKKKKPTPCDQKKEAAVCLKSVSPKKPFCIKKKKKVVPPKKKKECIDPFPIPKADWKNSCDDK